MRSAATATLSWRILLSFVITFLALQLVQGQTCTTDNYHGCCLTDQPGAFDCTDCKCPKPPPGQCEKPEWNACCSGGASGASTAICGMCICNVPAQLCGVQLLKTCCVSKDPLAMSQVDCSPCDCSLTPIPTPATPTSSDPANEKPVPAPPLTPHPPRFVRLPQTTSPPASSADGSSLTAGWIVFLTLVSVAVLVVVVLGVMRLRLTLNRDHRGLSKKFHRDRGDSLSIDFDDSPALSTSKALALEEAKQQVRGTLWKMAGQKKERDPYFREYPEDFTLRLRIYLCQHNRKNMFRVPELMADFATRESDLIQKMVDKYHGPFPEKFPDINEYPEYLKAMAKEEAKNKKQQEESDERVATKKKKNAAKKKIEKKASSESEASGSGEEHEEEEIECEPFTSVSPDAAKAKINNAFSVSVAPSRQ